MKQLLLTFLLLILDACCELWHMLAFLRWKKSWFWIFGYSLLWRNFRPRGPFLRELSLLLQYKESRAHTSLFSASLLWIWFFFYKITFFSSLRFSWHVPFQLNDVVRAMSPLPSHPLHTGFLTTIRLLCQNPVQTACITTVRNTCRYDFFRRLICHMKYFCGGY